MIQCSISWFRRARNLEKQKKHVIVVKYWIVGLGDLYFFGVKCGDPKAQLQRENYCNPIPLLRPHHVASQFSIRYLPQIFFKLVWVFVASPAEHQWRSPHSSTSIGASFSPTTEGSQTWLHPFQTSIKPIPSIQVRRRHDTHSVESNNAIPPSPSCEHIYI